MKIDEKLIDLCRHIDDLSMTVDVWVDDNADLLGAECDALHQMIRQMRGGMATLHEAVYARPCVGVVGASGSGKTHLIAGLAGRGATPLQASFDGHPQLVDYAKDICGEDNHRSGIVTRFSTLNTGTPTKFPVAVELLSQVDLINILAQSYFSGALVGRIEVPTVSDIEDLATRLGRYLAAGPLVGLSDDDIWRVRTNLERDFAGTPALRALAASGYWDYFTAMMPRLSHVGRAALLSVLWGGVPLYTQIYDQGVQALEKLGHERQAYCAMGALCHVDPGTRQVGPHPDSIINIKPLYRFEQDDDDTVLVRSKHGAWAAIKRSVLAILVQQVRIHLVETDTPLLAQIDILEFPGLCPAQAPQAPAAPGDAMADAQEDSAQTQKLLTLFAGQKAQHLFNDYHRRRELTCLIACADVTAPDLSHWARATMSWIDQTQDNDPARREKLETCLFVVLTKMDKVFDAAAQTPFDWSAGMDAALAHGIGRGYDWPGEWTTRRAFDNVTALRSPHHKAPQLCDYLNNGMELGIKSSRAKDVATARAAFLTDPKVRRHMGDPHAVWREIVEPGDGGVSLLSQSLVQLCTDTEKRRQISAEIAQWRAVLGQRLQRFYVSSDMFAQHDARRGAGQTVLRAMRHCIDHDAHGRLMRLLHLSEGELTSLLYNLDTNPYRENINYAPPVIQKPDGGLKSLSDSLQTIAGQGGAAHDPLEHNVPPGTVWQERGAQVGQKYARAVLRHWAMTLRWAALSPDVARHTGLPRHVFSSLIDEILAAAIRHNIEQRIGDAIEQSAGGRLDVAGQTAKAAMIAAEILGQFIDCLGFNEGWAEHHPRRKGRARSIIFPPRQTTNLGAIAQARNDRGASHAADWSIAYLAMVEDNAEYLRRTRFDLDEDVYLGQLLGELLPSEVWPRVQE